MEKVPELKTAIILIVIGILGWYFGLMLEKTGSGPMTTWMGLVSIVLGIVTLGWVAFNNYSPSKPADQPEPIDPDLLPKSGLSPREVKSLKIGAAGAVIVAVSMTFFNAWPGGSGKTWLYLGVYIGVTIAGFIIFYTAGYLYQSGQE
jgi:hypothetical protein